MNNGKFTKVIVSLLIALLTIANMWFMWFMINDRTTAFAAIKTNFDIIEKHSVRLETLENQYSVLIALNIENLKRQGIPEKRILEIIELAKEQTKSITKK